MLGLLKDKVSYVSVDDDQYDEELQLGGSFLDPKGRPS